MEGNLMKDLRLAEYTNSKTERHCIKYSVANAMR